MDQVVIVPIPWQNDFFLARDILQSEQTKGEIKRLDLTADLSLVVYHRSDDSVRSTSAAIHGQYDFVLVYAKMQAFTSWQSVQNCQSGGRLP